MALNLAWPRREIYNFSEPFHWYLQWGAFLFIGVVIAGGLLYYFLVGRHRIGVLADHAAPAREAEAAGAPPEPKAL